MVWTAENVAQGKEEWAIQNNFIPRLEEMGTNNVQEIKNKVTVETDGEEIKENQRHIVNSCACPPWDLERTL